MNILSLIVKLILQFTKESYSNTNSKSAEDENLIVILGTWCEPASSKL